MHTVSQVKQTLRDILSAGVYQKQGTSVSWWGKFMHWILVHLHLSGLASSRFRTFSIVLVCVCGLVLVMAVVWGLRRQAGFHGGRLLLAGNVRGDTTKGLLEEAGRALREERYPEMLHGLMEATLQSAIRQGWVKDARYKTLRQFARELQTVPDPEIELIFKRLADHAERVLYAGETLNREIAASLFQDVQTWVYRTKNAEATG